MNTTQKTNGKLITRLLLVVVGMFGFGYAMVPIYNVFCEVTGLNGKTGVIAAEESTLLQVDQTREITVEFIASINGGGAQWEFRPVSRKMKVNPGALYTTHYYARNKSSQQKVGQAVPSVAPLVASKHFDKTECFCFTQQRFAAGERREMPVTFVISPDLPRDVSTVTLSYTFFETKAVAEG